MRRQTNWQAQWHCKHDCNLAAELEHAQPVLRLCLFFNLHKGHLRRSLVEISERHAIERECEKLINRFYYLFNQDMSLVADMFTEEGVMSLGGWKLGPGPEVMKAPLHAGSKNMLDGVEVVLNTVSNVVVDAIDEDTAKGMSCDTFWEHGYYDGDLQGRPAPITSPIGINIWEDEFRCENGEWKFSSRVMKPVFNNKVWKLQRKRRGQ
jgi:hypothetical protein